MSDYPAAGEVPQLPSREALFDLRGRSVLVTGGTRGLGRAMAHGFASWGADVVVSSRDEESCRRVAGELQEYGNRAEWVTCNVGHWDQVERLADEAVARFGSIDVLVNNAGMSPLYPDPRSVTEALFDKTIAVNLKGPFRLAAILGAQMVENGKGSIINIGSTGSLRPTRHIIPYAAAKAGLTAMTIGFADAFGPQVRVNAILPGRFRTDVTKGWDEEMLSGARSRLSRIGEPSEIVGAAVYLASDASSYTTGSIMVLDGGSY
ncbi:glucose 1-dehydrogenase [Jatrophihabitans sp.]|uniref:SDR family NAD(P)-dependent oxidoreductase n=1 Tax=Jatrophihabitans sp. TaxID=1932789 RepID=UPI0030C6E7EC|nr:fabG2 6 [Jatrophihabitans sp.]